MKSFSALILILSLSAIATAQTSAPAQSSEGSSGLSYLVSLSPQFAFVNRAEPINLAVRVQSSSPEDISVAVGFIEKGLKREVCFLSSKTLTTDFSSTACSFRIVKPGIYDLYVDVLDVNFPKTEHMIDCSKQSARHIPGCEGSYKITVQ